MGEGYRKELAREDPRDTVYVIDQECFDCPFDDDCHPGRVKCPVNGPAMVKQQVRAREYYRENREMMSAKSRRWALANPEKVVAYQQRHREKNQEKNQEN